MVPFVVTERSINLTLKGKMYALTSSSPNFEEIKALLKGKEVDEEVLLALVDVKKKLESYSNGKISIKEDELYYGDRKIDNSLTRRIIAMIKEGYNTDPLVKFLDNLMENPSARSVNEFYEFLERNELPLTEDGCFLAYKKVRYDYLDIHSHTMSNAVGETVTMPRNAVDDDKERTCSYGLHFASFDYMPHYGTNDVDDRIVILKINPRDVVSFPTDYERAKGRCCRYEVVDEIKNDGKTEIKKFFASLNDYGKSLDILHQIKELDILADKKDIKYSSRFADFELNNFSIRTIVDKVLQNNSITIPFEYVPEELHVIRSGLQSCCRCSSWPP